MTQQTIFIAMNRRDKQWRQCIERAFQAYSDVFTLLAPNITDNADPDHIPNCLIAGHPPGQPNVLTNYTIPFVEFMGGDRMGDDRANWDELAGRHAENYLKIFKKRNVDQAKLAQARAQEHLPS